MPHIQPDLIQRFLADEADLAERDIVTEHLACCDECSALLAALAAEDDTLADALRLDPAEAEWLGSIDLTEPVLAKLRPWYWEPGTIITAVIVAVPALLALQTVSAMLDRQLVIESPIGFTISLIRSLGPALWRMAAYMSRGGLLLTIWPALVLAAGIGLYLARTKKEERTNA